MTGAVTITPHPHRKKALLIALVADALQFALLPLFAMPFLEPLDAGIDVVVGIVLVRLLGWHWAFLPSFATELIPGVDLIPTWTAAVWLVTRKGKTQPAPLPKLP